jgi:hypothetical protein
MAPTVKQKELSEEPLASPRLGASTSASPANQEHGVNADSEANASVSVIHLEEPGQENPQSVCSSATAPEWAYPFISYLRDDKLPADEQET